ncbi:MAG TPA: CDP-glycerol glycerophosphotransferase family protein, partial [Acetobacteraceae bacterium]|nr:CDP-glycerol glycerophosphotransferase family protein [Acetobacteraceae bacterium]
IACEVLRVSPEHEVVVFARNAEQLRLARRLAAFYPGHHRLVFEVLRPSRLPGRLKRRKRAVLLANRARLAACDALVLPERNSVFLRRIWARRPKLIHTFHGPSGHDRVDDVRLKQFDLLLAPSARRLRRILEAGNARPGRAAVVGYSKFDLVRRMGLERPSPFNNGRPTVLYNPHHRPGTSSWHAMGRAVLDHFAARDDLNLVFAPHVKLFHPPAEHLDAFRDYAGLDHIRIDLGSEASVDMTHLLTADIYLGDISSQVFEFLVRPRPCLFLNPHRLAWRDDPDFESWHLGPVVGTIGEMAQRLATVADWQPEFAPRQVRAFAEAFAEPHPMSAPELAARVIAGFLAHGRVEAAWAPGAETGPALDPSR